MESFGVERLNRVSFDNNGYYPTVDDGAINTTCTRVDGDNGDRRQLIVEGITERGLSRPQRNVIHNT